MTDALNVTYYPVNMALANSASGGLLVFLTLMVFGIIVLALLITSIERFTKFFKMFDKLINSIKYTIIGSGISISLYGIYTICVMLAEFGSGVNPIHIGLGVVGYVVITITGYIASKVAIKFSKMHSDYKKSNTEIECPKETKDGLS